MAERVVHDQERAVIGVCGVQGSGKSVFLTCVFQSIDMVIPHHGELTFDRKDIGGARYFERLEEEIRQVGAVPGTKDKIQARLFLRIDDKESSFADKELPIDLVDFAGRYFHTFSDLGPSLDISNLSPDERQEAVEISEFLERCDGLIILVSATLFPQSGGGQLKENPFPKSIPFLLDYCRKHKRPVALVFSQADKAPELTQAKIEEFDRVKKFRMQFTSNLQESIAGTRPYGTVELISCYEQRPDGLPKTQNSEGSIWRPEASKVFLKIVSAAWPHVRRRLEKRQKEKDRLAQLAVRESETDRSRALWKTVALGVFFALLVSAGAWLYRNNEQQQVVSMVEEVADLVSAGSEVNSEQLSRLQDAWQLSQESDVRDLRTAFQRLASELESAAGSYIESPSLDAKHKVELTRLRTFESLNGIAPYPWWTPELSTKMEARTSFLDQWLARVPAEPDPIAQILLLEEKKTTFERLGDLPFLNLLVEKSTQLKKEQVETVVSRDLALASTLTDRLQAIKKLLYSMPLPEDSEYRMLLRGRLARALASTILIFEENPPLLRLLQNEFPSLKEDPLGSLKLNLILRTIRELEVPPPGMLEQVTQIEAAVSERRFEVESVLVDIFAGLTFRDRIVLWREMTKELKQGYAFDLSPEAMAPDAEPLPQVLERLLDNSWDEARAKQLILEQSLYFSELQAIASAASVLTTL